MLSFNFARCRSDQKYINKFPEDMECNEYNFQTISHLFGLYSRALGFSMAITYDNDKYIVALNPENNLDKETHNNLAFETIKFFKLLPKKCRLNTPYDPVFMEEKYVCLRSCCYLLTFRHYKL